MDCLATLGYFLHSNGTCLKCYISCETCTGASNNQCTSCSQGYYLQPLPNLITCETTCPYGYVTTSQRTCGKCSNNNQAYYNRTCVNTCPLATYQMLNTYQNQYECQPCYLGCDTCTSNDKYACSSCSEGFFYYNSTCSTGCPPDMYANPQTKVCEQCQPPCVTCSKPNAYSCTNCGQGYYLLNGTCVTDCPAAYYRGFLGDDNLLKVSACLPKLLLSFKLRLTTEARVINIEFNYGIVHMILAISRMFQIEIANTQIDSIFFSLSPLTKPTIKFEYLGDQYNSSFSLLNVMIDLDSDDNNSSIFVLLMASTIQLKGNLSLFGN